MNSGEGGRVLPELAQHPTVAQLSARLGPIERCRVDAALGWLKLVGDPEAAIPQIWTVLGFLEADLPALLLQGTGASEETEAWETKEHAVSNLDALIAALEKKIADAEKTGVDTTSLREELDGFFERKIEWMERQAEELKTDGSAPGLAKSEIPDAKKAAWNTPKNVDDLATLIMSEASVGNADERAAVGYTVLNRMLRNGASNVSDVWGAYAHGQNPTEEIKDLAAKILRCDIPDNSGGATHYYSPRSMPMEGGDTVDADVGGGLEQTPRAAKEELRARVVQEVPARQDPGRASEPLQVLSPAREWTRPVSAALRAPLAAILCVLLVGAPTRIPAEGRGKQPSQETVVNALTRLTRTQRLRNFPNSHVKSADRGAAEQARAASEIRDLTRSLAARLTPACAAVLDVAVEEADPDALERAQAAIRVLGATGVSWNRIRVRLPVRVGQWENVLERSWREGRELCGEEGPR